jgi:predicted Zn-dependent protease
MMLDIGYTLKSSPNHHRALLTLVNLGAKTKSLQPGALEYSIECWFDRALRYRPDDNIVRMIFAQYLVQIGRAPDAKQQLTFATSAAGDNPLTHHNIGLVYFEMGEFDMALVQAHEARKLGFERSRLESLLVQKGKWQEPK